MPSGDWRPRSDCPPRPRLGLALARVSTLDDDGTSSSSSRSRRPSRRPAGRAGGSGRSAAGGPRRPASPPPGAVALARLAGLVALAIAVVVGLVFWVGSCQGQSRHDEYASYMDDDAADRAELRSARCTTSQKQVSTPEAHARRPPDEARAVVAAAAAGLRPGAAPAAARAAPGGASAGAGDAPAAGDRARQPGEHALGQRGNEARHRRSRTTLAKQAQLLSASDLVWTELFKLPATDTLKRLGRERRDRPAVADRHEPRIVSASLVRRGLRRLCAPRTDAATAT